MAQILGIALSLVLSSSVSFSQDLSLTTEERSQPFPEGDEYDQAFHQGFECFLFNMFSNEFGYTLIGAKAISLKEISRSKIDKAYTAYLSTLKEMFGGVPNFCLKVFDWGPPYPLSLVLINREALKKLVSHNPVVRSYIKHNFQCEENFYTKLEDPQQDITDIVHDERILGHLLGYSKSNIEYYLRRMKVGRYLQKYPLYRFHPLPGAKYCGNSMRWNVSPCYKHIKPSKGFKSLESEWQWIQDVAWDLNEETLPSPPYFISLPFYICRHGRDSELARERFKKASSKIAELFYKKSFREAIFEMAQKPNQES